MAKDTPPQKGLIAANISTTGNKDEAWYSDSTAGVQGTHDQKVSVYPDLDESYEAITANGDILHIRGTGILAIEIFIDGAPS